MVIYGPLILAIKLSILSMLARFFHPYQQWVIFIYAFSGFLMAYTIAVTTAKICICNPINTVWYVANATHGTCLRQSDIFITDATINVVTDLIILILPIVLISKLNMPLKKKTESDCCAGGRWIGVLGDYRTVGVGHYVPEHNRPDLVD
jgi:hypothetical protein